MAKKQKKTIGLLNRGKNNTFIDITTEGFDVGFQDEGEGTLGINVKAVKQSGGSALKKWFSMQNPIVYLLVGLALVLASVFLAS